MNSCNINYVIYTNNAENRVIVSLYNGNKSTMTFFIIMFDYLY